MRITLLNRAKKTLGFFAFLGAFALAVPAANAQKICIDPGHGGSDPGAVGGGQQEKANVLDQGLKLRTWLNNDTADGAGGGSWSTIITRTTDVFVSLSGRANFANNNGAARFMCIHNNGFSSTSANGMETFSYSSSGNGADLRNKVQQESLIQWPITNRGNKTANFYVLVNTSMPAELHEAAFITNAADRVYLGSSTHRNNNSKAAMFAAQRHYGHAKYTPGSGGGSFSTTIDNSSGSFTPGTGWWVGSSTPGYFGSNYHVRPTEAISDVSTWNFSVPSAGTYRVEAWWSAGSNRAPAAPYIINGGSVPVNQQVNGGQWNSLGNHSFSAGANNVKLSCWTSSGYYVIADAIRVRTP